MFYKIGDEYGFGFNQVRQRFPNVSFPRGQVITDFPGVEPYEPTEPPAYNAVTHEIREAPPANGVQQWEIVALSPEQVAINQQIAQELLQNSVVEATQQRLDTFAMTRNYDGILSAATYATSVVPKFQAEGQYAVQARDATWSKLYEVLEEVQAGTRPVPTGYADIEPLLPVLQWPL